MAEQFSLLGQVQQVYGELHADALEMMSARAELAQLELRLSQQRAARLGMCVGVCLLVGAAGFVVLVHLVVENLPNIGGLTRPQTLGLWGGLMLIAGLSFAWLAIRRFFRKYRHFEQSLAEFQADAELLSLWVKQAKQGG